MPDGLHEDDAVDWPWVIEKIEDVGLSGLRACRSLLRQAMVHLLKLHAWPGSLAGVRWRNEAGVFLADAEDCFTPSIGPRFELDALCAKALGLAREAEDANGEPRPLPDACPFPLGELVAGNVAGLLARLGSRREGDGC